MTGSESERQRPSLAATAFAALPYATLAGCAGLVLTAVFGFEEPDVRWLAGSSALLLTAPLGLLLHLTFTQELTRNDKRLWLASFAGLKDPGLFAEYFTAGSRGAATERLRAVAREADGE